MEKENELLEKESSISGDMALVRESSSRSIWGLTAYEKSEGMSNMSDRGDMDELDVVVVEVIKSGHPVSRPDGKIISGEVHKLKVEACGTEVIRISEVSAPELAEEAGDVDE